MSVNSISVDVVVVAVILLCVYHIYDLNAAISALNSSSRLDVTIRPCVSQSYSTNLPKNDLFKYSQFLFADRNNDVPLTSFYVRTPLRSPLTSTWRHLNSDVGLEC